MAPYWELPARSMANPEQPPASCFTADWGETIKKRPLCSVWSRGEALARSPHTAAELCEKVQTTYLNRAGWGPLGVAKDTWLLSALKLREVVVYSSDSWWNWTTRIWANTYRIMYVPYTVETNLQYWCNLHDLTALGRLICPCYICFDDVFNFRKTTPS